ncbi:DUF5723 family protein [Gaoshiqia sediminis]|uniref:DUF5723 family protein n=1 Tax=Gaoshiqia sediminis TaxID=2986998 RepID=A0AA42C7F4_9BACT|nr:DUF5723 family protein [Gaoshiqia sediminis]MCW0483514.1 DUF5723 family protein [Gaoshiqia sediminis]
MKQAKISYILFMIVSLLGQIQEGHAQSSLLLYQLNEGPGVNPAILPTPEKYSFSIFPLAGTSVSYNSHDEVRNAFDIGTSNPSEEEITDIFKGFIHQKLVYQQADITWLSLGLRTKAGNFSMQVSEHAYGTVRLRGNLLDFFVEESETMFQLGNEQNFPGEGIHFRKYSLGYAKEMLHRKLEVGFRANLYFGKSFLSSDFSGSITEENERFYVRSSGQLNFSAPVTIIESPDGSKDLAASENSNALDYLTNTKNVGTGIDLGLKYTVSPYLHVTASAMNLGTINFKNNLQTLDFNGQSELTSDKVSRQVLEDGTVVLVKNVDEISLSETFENLYEVAGDQPSSFNTTLPAIFIAGANYQVGTNLSVGLTDRLVKHNKLNYNSLLLSATTQITRHLHISLGYAAIAGSYANIPFGLQYKWPGGSAYLITDNVLPVLDDSLSDIRGLSFGASFYPFRPKTKYQEVPYLPFFRLKKQRRNR